MMPQGFRATACRLRRLFMLMPILASCAAACATAQPVQQPAGSSAAGPVPGAAPELRVVTPDGQVRLSYGGLNTLGPTILDRNLERFIAWPPTFRTLAKDDARGIRLGMTSAQAGSIAEAIPLVRSEGGEEAGATIWYEDLGRPAPGFMGQPSTPPLACGPDARRQLAMPTPQRLHYRSCLAVRADPSAARAAGSLRGCSAGCDWDTERRRSSPRVAGAGQRLFRRTPAAPRAGRDERAAGRAHRDSGGDLGGAAG